MYYGVPITSSRSTEYRPFVVQTRLVLFDGVLQHVPPSALTDTTASDPVECEMPAIQCTQRAVRTRRIPVETLAEILYSTNKPRRPYCTSSASTMPQPVVPRDTRSRILHYTGCLESHMSVDTGVLSRSSIGGSGRTSRWDACGRCVCSRFPSHHLLASHCWIQIHAKQACALIL